jgi:hypothetical protein
MSRNFGWTSNAQKKRHMIPTLSGGGSADA